MGLVLLAVVPALGLALFHGLAQRQNAKDEAKAGASQMALALAGAQQELLASGRQLVETLAATTVVRVLDPQGCAQLFAQLMQQSGGAVANILVVSATGEHLTEAVAAAGDFFPAERTPLGQASYAERDWFRETVRTGRFWAGNLAMNPAGRPTMVIACPARGWDGGIKAIVAACLTLDPLSRYLQDAPPPPGSLVGVVSAAGTLLASFPDSDGKVGQNISNTPLASMILGRRDGSAEVPGLGGIARLVGFARLFSGLSDSPVVYVGIPREIAYAKAQAMLRAQMAWLVLVGLVGLGVAWLMGTRLLHEPILGLVEAAEAIGRGELAVRLHEKTRTVELDRLAQAFNRMAEGLEERQRGLVQKTQELQNSNRDLEQFAYVASHDLQEPLRKITSFSDLLVKRYAGQFDETGQRYINYMVDGARRMSQLINHLLTYSRLGTHGKAFARMAVGEALDMALDNLQMALEETGATVRRDALPVVTADAAQITQLFQNLVGNALKYRNQAAPVVTVSAARLENAWEIRVADNGLGIAVQHHERIFRMFQRLHTAKEYPGVGIGLSFCKRIVERHGGRIWVESEAGQGSTFHFTLPDIEENAA